MAFAQLTYRDSLRDIEARLRSLGGKLYHMGFRGRVARSTLADANDAHDWRIYAEFAQVLIRIARPLYASDPIGVDLDQSLYALDSTTIDLPWQRKTEETRDQFCSTSTSRFGVRPTCVIFSCNRITSPSSIDVSHGMHEYSLYPLSIHDAAPRRAVPGKRSIRAYSRHPAD
jgi:hypothetical protein